MGPDSKPKPQLKPGLLAVTSALAVWGCTAPAPAPTVIETQVSAGGGSRRVAETRLINEGGPVFEQPKPADPTRLINEGGPVYAIPGEVVPPTYFRGQLSDLHVTAERLGGVRVETIPEAQVDAQGRFTLEVPQGEQAFLASTVFPHGEAVVRMRTLVKPGPEARITLDPLETLVAGRISYAYQRGNKVDLDRVAPPTRELVPRLRAGLPAPALGLVPLIGTNLALSRELNALAGLQSDALYELAAWEQRLGIVPSAPDPLAPVELAPPGEPPK